MSEKEYKIKCENLFRKNTILINQQRIDAEHIRALQKQNGELTDKVGELEAQIEKMKNCGNCKNEGDYKEPYRYGTGWCNICKRHKVAKGNFDKWEIKEK